MGNSTWGLLGPERIASERRTRTLGLGATVRTFNDLAVPGFGGIWFGKQVFLATLGVAVAERLRNSDHRVTNIGVANAVEAIGCWLALDHRNWASDPRVRGATKMREKNDLSFAKVRKPNFYVTQPMRQATIQPLRAFGLVDSIGERFNGFTCSDAGMDFIDAVCHQSSPSNRSVLEHLFRWTCGDDVKMKTSKLREALSPIETMSKSGREFLRERVASSADADARQRMNALAWVEYIRANPGKKIKWDRRPPMLDEAHWRNLHAGALFFLTRDAAIRLLDQIETQIGQRSDRRMPLDKPLQPAIVARCRELRQFAQAFIDNSYDPTTNCEAIAFCRECNDSSDVHLIENLLSREGRVLQQRSRDVVPGVAFRGIQMPEFEPARSDEESGAETSPPNRIAWPPGISHRVNNLFLFNLDLRGELDEWLQQSLEDRGGRT